MNYPREKDTNKCPEIVPTAGLRMSYHQCRMKVCKDGYCRVHHPDAVKARREAAQVRYNEQQAKPPWQQLKIMHERAEVAEGHLAVAREALKRIGYINGIGVPRHTPEADIAREALTLTAPKV